ncbi:hypothetical protein MNBD_UNCLBAC01-834 [hydrothermal vent metagenome]|uniref:Uncharacterized protein TP-0789 domain-containing protein n=1 Tax=hydrothermal vent metagenome TaxID=652676 RepID=A0A3B1DK95_9ZZZZ
MKNIFFFFVLIFILPACGKNEPQPQTQKHPPQEQSLFEISPKNITKKEDTLHISKIKNTPTPKEKNTVSTLAYAEPPIQLEKKTGIILSAEEIMTKVFYREDGNDSFATTEMILIDKKGRKRKRILEISTKDFGEIMKSFLEFLEPADIKETKFLSWENEGKDDTQYLYLPALGRSRRIVSSQKNLQFVNTDFTYEDMQRRHPTKDTHKILRKDIFNGNACYVIESLPNKNTSQYTKRISWIDQEKFVILRTDFYDKKMRKVKEFRVNRIEKYQNIWTAFDIMMRDVKEEHTTLMNIIEIKYDQGIKDNIFTQRHLEE